MTDLRNVEIGPGRLPTVGPLKLRFAVSGEWIRDCQIEVGFCSKGIEKAMCRSHWYQGLVYAGHVDPEGAVFGELVYCLAVESLFCLEVPPRAQTIRVLLSELYRMSSHLGYLIRCASAVGAQTIVQYILRDRERVFDLVELLTGGRFTPSYIRFGGVASDATEGFIERLHELCFLMRDRIKEYNDLLTFNQSFLRRVKGLGVLPLGRAESLSVTGPTARASGAGFDVRKDHAYSGYESFDFTVPRGTGEFGVQGDCFDRFLIRIREILQSLEILRQAAEKLEPGHFRSIDLSARFWEAKMGEAYSRVESPRGLLGIYLVSGGNEVPHQVQFRTPTTYNLGSLSEIIKGHSLGDARIILASLDLSIAEVDR